MSVRLSMLKEYTLDAHCQVFPVTWAVIPSPITTHLTQYVAPAFAASPADYHTNTLCSPLLADRPCRCTSAAPPAPRSFSVMGSFAVSRPHRENARCNRRFCTGSRRSSYLRVHEQDGVLLPLDQPEDEVRMKITDAILRRVIIWQDHPVQRFVGATEQPPIELHKQALLRI